MKYWGAPMAADEVLLQRNIFSCYLVCWNQKYVTKHRCNIRILINNNIQRSSRFTRNSKALIDFVIVCIHTCSRKNHSRIKHLDVSSSPDFRSSRFLSAQPGASPVEISAAGHHFRNVRYDAVSPHFFTY